MEELIIKEFPDENEDSEEFQNIVEIKSIISDKCEKIEEVGNDKEKQRLIKTLEKTKIELNKKGKKTIRDVYLSYSEEEFMKDKKIRENRKNNVSIFFYKFLLFIIKHLFI